MMTGVARADIPRLINFQGRLADTSGTPLNDGHLRLAWRIMSQAQGTGASDPCDSGIETDIGVNGGLFNINLGESAGPKYVTCGFTGPMWLEVTICPAGTAPCGNSNPSQVWMGPRIPLGGAAYAITARQLAYGAGTIAAGVGANQVPVNVGGSCSTTTTVACVTDTQCPSGEWCVGQVIPSLNAQKVSDGTTTYDGNQLGKTTDHHRSNTLYWCRTGSNIQNAAYDGYPHGKIRVYPGVIYAIPNGTNGCTSAGFILGYTVP
jgi:hypothetical protein